MNSIEQIQQAIDGLQSAEFWAITQWIRERAVVRWDAQIDSQSALSRPEIYADKTFEIRLRALPDIEERLRLIEERVRTIEQRDKLN
jgi:hypothetical protein